MRRTFSWAHTVDVLLASYARAITDYRARHGTRDMTARRYGRRFAMRRGARASSGVARAHRGRARRA